MDGTEICCGFDENLQLAAIPFINSIIPTAVFMHIGTQDEESDDEECENLYAASCKEDLDHLSNDELQFLVHSLSGQLRKTGKPATCGTCAEPPKKKATESHYWCL